MNINELKDFLDYKVNQYNTPAFIADDPISLPHSYTLKEDVEIAGFLISIISWGNRKAIVKSGDRLGGLLGVSPYDLVMSHKKPDLKSLSSFKHRTFNGNDLVHLIKALKVVYTRYGGLEGVFNKHKQEHTLQPAIHELKKLVYSIDYPSRTTKHISDPLTGSAAKKINMFLRWMIRSDENGVDFGIWKTISAATLSCPLDLHSGNVARKLGLLHRKQNDAKAVMQLDESLRLLDKEDPVKYDFALFGLGIFEKF